MLGGRSHRLSVSGETNHRSIRQAGNVKLHVHGRTWTSPTLQIRCVQACNEQTKGVLHPVHHLQCTGLMRRGTRGCKAVLVLTFLRRRPSPLATTRAKPLHVAIPHRVNSNYSSL